MSPQDEALRIFAAPFAYRPADREPPPSATAVPETDRAAIPATPQQIPGRTV